MLTHISIVDGKFTLTPDGFPKVDVYMRPDEAESRHLIDDLKISEYTFHSALDPDETPRIEFEDDYFAIIMKCPKKCTEENDFSFVVGTIGAFFFYSGNIVTVHADPIPHEQFRRLPGSRDGIHSENLNTWQDIMLRWLSQVIRRFEVNLRTINSRGDQLKKKMNCLPDNRHLMSIFTLREGLVYYADALRGNGHLIERLRTAAGKIGFSQENMELLEDLAIENQQFLEQAQVGSLVLTELMDTWSSIINNNLSVIMKNMNSLMIAIAIPSFFTGLGGMSEFTSFTSPWLAWYVSYPLFFGIMLLVSGLIFKLVQFFFKI